MLIHKMCSLNRMYLKNKICVFTPLFKIDYYKKQNILSCSLFKLENSYKNFDLYINGLCNLNLLVQNNMKNYRIRLFIDNNIFKDESIVNILYKLSHVDLVLYTSNYDTGLFGTLIRFFPMFNFENNDSNVVWVVDADYKEQDNYLQFYKDFCYFTEKTNNYKQVEIYYYGRIFHIASIDRGNIILPYAVAWKIFNIKKIQKEILIKYITDVKNNTNKLKYTLYPKQKININTSNFIFGVDEYFINKTLFDNFLTNNICFTYKLQCQLHNPLFFLLEQFKNDASKKNRVDFNKCIYFVTKLDKQFNNLNIEQKYNVLDKILYKKLYNNDHKKPHTNQYFDLNFRLMIVYIIYYKIKKYNIVSKILLELFLKKYKYSQFEILNYVGCKSNNEIISGIEIPVIKRNLLLQYIKGYKTFSTKLINYFDT